MIKKAFQTILNQMQTPEPWRVPWEIRWLTLFLTGVYLIFFFTSLMIVSNLMDSPLDNPNPNVMVGVCLLCFGLLSPVLYQYVDRAVVIAHQEKRLKGQQTTWDYLALNPPRIPLWGVAMVGFALAVVLDTLGLVLGVEPASLPIPLADLDESDTLFLLVAAFVVLIVRPIADELLFRGIWYPVLLKHFSAVYAVGVSSVIYAGICYLLDPRYLWWGFITPLVIGLCAGVARSATKSTQTAIVLHSMFGLFAILRAILN